MQKNGSGTKSIDINQLVRVLAAVCIGLMSLPAAGMAAENEKRLPVPESQTSCYQIVCRDDVLEQMMLRYIPEYK